MNSSFRRALLAVLALAATAAVPAPAAAQIGAISRTVNLAQFFVRGVDTAADPTTGNYLVVGGAGRLIGTCVNPEGQPVSGPFEIKPASATFAAFPRAAWGQHLAGAAGGFLVVWSEEVGTFVNLHSRVVTCSQGAIGPDQVISDVHSAWLENGNVALAYSPAIQHFLVAWKSFPPNVQILARLVNIHGTGVGGIAALSDGFGRDPSVAWNSALDEFGVAFSGENADRGYSAFVRTPAANIGAFSRNTFNGLPSGLTAATDLAYNPTTNRWVMAWYQTHGTLSQTAEFDAAGNLTQQNVVSGLLGSYDAMSMAYNPLSNSMLMVGLDRRNDNMLATELNLSGVRYTDELAFTDTRSEPAARYPRVAGSSRSKSWHSVWSANFTFIGGQTIVTSSGGGGGVPAPIPPPPPPPPPPTDPRMHVDSPGANATVAGAFYIGGWAIDAGAPASSGVDVVQAWAHPVGGGNPIFLGTASYGIGRGDIAGIFGARFGGAGFQLVASIPAAGVYDLVVYAHSTVAGTFNNARSVRLNVLPPPSMPRMWVDVPEQNQSVSQNVTVSGWAVDLNTPGGPGVDAVHVWAYPAGGGAPVFVGAAPTGGGRPDVAAAFGSANFGGAGFYLTGTLPRGTYDLVTFAHSVVVRSFNNAFTIRINVL